MIHMCVVTRFGKPSFREVSKQTVTALQDPITLVKSDFQLFLLQIPSRKLVGKDRVAVVAKQLNDFIYLYNRETDLYSEGGDKPNIVPSKRYQRFLAAAT